MGRKFHTPSDRIVRYSVGQPMGFLSSWSVFSLTHHVLIRTAFSTVGEKPKYWMLGDDVVVGSTRASDVYREMLECLGVEISLGKSVISPSGREFEFAKRLAIDREISPLP